MTQNESILNWLQRGPITPVQAMNAFGCMRLAARIAELRETHDIETETVKTPSARYARYRLVK